MVREKGEGERTVGTRLLFSRLNSPICGIGSRVPIVPPATWQRWYDLLVNAHLDEQVECDGHHRIMETISEVVIGTIENKASECWC